jgi:hypothetical protein
MQPGDQLGGSRDRLRAAVYDAVQVEDHQADAFGKLVHRADDTRPEGTVGPCRKTLERGASEAV